MMLQVEQLAGLSPSIFLTSIEGCVFWTRIISGKKSFLVVLNIFSKHLLHPSSTLHVALKLVYLQKSSTDYSYAVRQ